MENKSKYYLLAALGVTFVIAMQILGPIWSENNIFQDDFRQSLFWGWTFWDPELFQNDFFMPMYQSHMIRTPLLSAVYHLAPVITDNLIWYTKFLVLVIFLISALAVYLFFDKVSRKPILAFASTVIFSICFWCTDHVSAAHSRSLVWFGIFLYMYLKACSRDKLALFFIFVLLFLSPHAFLICLVMEFMHSLLVYKKDFFNFKNVSFIGLGLNAIAVLVLYKIIFKNTVTQGVGTAFTKQEMMALPEFNPGGRHPIFGSHFMDGTWWTNEHWGLGIGYLPISKIIIIAAIAIPVYLILEHLVFRNKINYKAIFDSMPFVLLLSSTLLYFLAQISFPALYLPSRFIALPWLIVSLIILILIFDQYLERFITYISSLKSNKSKTESVSSFAWLRIVILLGSAFGFWYYAFTHNFYFTRYVSITPEVKAILETTPKDSLIAGHPLLPDLNSASIASKRKVFVDYERSMAYTKESLAEIRRRNFVALELTYAKSKEDFLRIAHENGITHFMALYDFYSPGYLANPVYIDPYTLRLRELTQLKEGETFFIEQFLKEKNLRYGVLDVQKL